MLMDSLQGQLKNDFAAVIFLRFIYFSKITQKKHSLCPYIVNKSLIGLKFCRNMLMGNLQGQLINGFAEVFFFKLFE